MAGEASPLKEIPITPRAARTLGVDMPEGQEEHTVIDLAFTPRKHAYDEEVQVDKSESDKLAVPVDNRPPLRGRVSQAFTLRKKPTMYFDSSSTAESVASGERGHRFKGMKPFALRNKTTPTTPISISSPMLVSTTATQLVHNESNIRAGPHNELQDLGQTQVGMATPTPTHKTFYDDTASTSSYSDDGTHTVRDTQSAQPVSHITSQLPRSATTPDMRMAHAAPYELEQYEISDEDDEGIYQMREQPIFGSMPNYRRAGRIVHSVPQEDEIEKMLEEDKAKLARMTAEREVMDAEVAQMKIEHEKFKADFEQRYRVVDFRGAIKVQPGMVKLVDVKKPAKSSE